VQYRIMGSRKHQLQAIRAGRGSLKRKPSDKPLSEDWAKYKREEKELEERKFQRLAALGKK
jgi:hypothetical protein